MKKSVIGISVFMCFALIAVMFAGCGKPKTIKISELFDDDTIWYLCTTDNGDGFDKGIFDKDSVVETAYLINGDKLKVCHFDDERTLGDFENMDESEIKKQIEEVYNNKITSLLNSYIRTASPLLEKYSKDDLASLLENIAAEYIYDVGEIDALFDDYDSSNPMYTAHYTYDVDKNEYVERANSELVFSKLSGIFYDQENTDYRSPYTEYKSEESESGEHIYTIKIKFSEPIESVRNEMNAFYEKYPLLKSGIEAVINGENAYKVAENIINKTNEQIESTEEYKSVKAEGEKILKENDGYKYKLALVSDGTGNTVNQEGFIYQKFNLEYKDGKVVTEYNNEIIGILDEDYWDYTADAMSLGIYYKGDYYNKDGNCIQVYDSFYGGWSYSDDNGGSALCTRLKKNSNVVLDEIDSKKFIIDPKDEIIEKAFD